MFYQNICDFSLKFVATLHIQGVAAKQGKNSGVKKLLVVGAVPFAAENYFNVKAILDQVAIEALEFTVAADVKMCKYEMLFTN